MMVRLIVRHNLVFLPEYDHDHRAATNPATNALAMNATNEA
jgi:hypothetical protein